MTPAERVAAYLEGRAAAFGADFSDYIHWVRQDGQEVDLTVSDLRAVLAEREALAQRVAEYDKALDRALNFLMALESSETSRDKREMVDRITRIQYELRS